MVDPTKYEQASSNASGAIQQGLQVKMAGLAHAGTARSRITSRLRICLAASGGGHIRQLLDLERAWSRYDYFFLSEDTALSRSISKKHPTHYVPHFAFGQIRREGLFKMISSGFRNCVASAGIMFRTRPHVVITTGAGAAFFTIFWARMLGAKIVLVESLARFDKPSIFAQLVAPFAHRKVVQSEGLADVWPDAEVFDPLQTLDTPRPAKKPLLFATVGAILPFDRMVKMVAELKARGDIPEDVIIQTGENGFSPDGIQTVETLPFEDMLETMENADIVVCHGGTGSLITALRQGCRIIAVPRLVQFGEVYDDHQSEITGAFESRGLVSVANTTEELAEALKQVRSRPPVSATSDPSGLIDHLEDVLSGWSKAKRG
jgi:UDP-N-acetylglucosamine transferase subunit ALG13